MIRSIRGPKNEHRQTPGGQRPKKGESFACSTGHAFTANRALTQWIVVGLTTNYTNATNKNTLHTTFV